MFYPTHRHADGGLYQYMGPQLGKSSVPSFMEWDEGVAYRDEEGRMFWTNNERWSDRFELLPEADVPTMVFQEQDEVTAFKFRIVDVADVRYMLITAGARPHSSLPAEWVDWMKRVLRMQAEMVSQGLHIRAHDFPDLIGDVHAFHAKFGQEYIGKPRMLPQDLHDFRIKFHDEETHEYRDEYVNLVDAVMRQDRRDIVNVLELQLDALVDAAWVILGTADLQFGRDATYAAWRRVVEANMKKVLKADTKDGDGSVDSGRAPKYDIVKPAGWLAPDHRDLVQDNAIFDSWVEEEPVETNTFNQDAGSYSDTRAV